MNTPENHHLTAEELFEREQSALKPTTQRSQRSLAFHFLYAMDRSGYDQPLNFILDDFRDGYEVEFSDDSFAVTMVRGVLEHMREIDPKMLPLLQNWTIDRLGCCTVIILRMAFWELCWTTTPAQVVINEAVELAKAFAENDAHKFINGVLDTYCEQAGIKREAPAKTPTS